jgi:diguanylate cyclase (GGDEF)-like protein
LSIHALSNEAGIITNYIGIFDDISDKKNAEQRLTHLANYDVLTDLPNRHLMQNQAQSMIEHSIELKQHLGLIFIDLDKFKHINDSLGHPVGDQVLLETATRFKQETSPNMLLSRWGGDEFIVVIPNASHLIVSTLVKRLINSLQRPFILAGQKHYLGLSAGISLFPQDGQTVEQLLRCADTAMYQAKHEGANLYRFYEGGMHADVERFMQLDNGLRHAIAAEGEGLRMVFQPQYSNDGKTLISAEALIRWQDETLGFISPAEFIPIAEETGQIIPLGYWIVKEVARHYQQLSQLGCHLVPISINCSAHQLAEPELASNIHKMLLHYDVPSQHVMIEVTESAVMRNETLALKALAELKSFGYRISIDDFGTGYSCLSYIQKISPAEIKIDQRFVGSMTTENDSRNIVHFTHGLAHSMGIDVVAEGVETEAQLIALQAIGDIKIQGYLLSRPLAFEAFAALLTTKEA